MNTRYFILAACCLSLSTSGCAVPYFASVRGPIRSIRVLDAETGADVPEATVSLTVANERPLPRPAAVFADLSRSLRGSGGRVSRASCYETPTCRSMCPAAWAMGSLGLLHRQARRPERVSAGHRDRRCAAAIGRPCSATRSAASSRAGLAPKRSIRPTRPRQRTTRGRPMPLVLPGRAMRIGRRRRPAIPPAASLKRETSSRIIASGRHNTHGIADQSGVSRCVWRLDGLSMP